jgi:hypothetical protein
MLVLSAEVVAKDKMCFLGMVDMAIEARVLSSVEHPNIIKLRSLANGNPYDDKFFIIMDRLYETLEHRITKKWRGRLRKETGLMRDRSGEKAKALYEERLVVAYDLVSAAVDGISRVLRVERSTRTTACSR